MSQLTRALGVEHTECSGTPVNEAVDFRLAEHSCTFATVHDAVFCAATYQAQLWSFERLSRNFTPPPFATNVAFQQLSSTSRLILHPIPRGSTVGKACQAIEAQTHS